MTYSWYPLHPIAICSKISWQSCCGTSSAFVGCTHTLLWRTSEQSRCVWFYDVWILFRWDASLCAVYLWYKRSLIWILNDCGLGCKRQWAWLKNGNFHQPLPERSGQHLRLAGGPNDRSEKDTGDGRNGMLNWLSQAVKLVFKLVVPMYRSKRNGHCKNVITYPYCRSIGLWPAWYLWEEHCPLSDVLPIRLGGYEKFEEFIECLGSSRNFYDSWLRQKYTKTFIQPSFLRHTQPYLGCMVVSH